jgi:hypothetical protein
MSNMLLPPATKIDGTILWFVLSILPYLIGFYPNTYNQNIKYNTRPNYLTFNELPLNMKIFKFFDSFT